MKYSISILGIMLGIMMILQTSSALAHEVRNGGAAVVCYSVNNAKESIELFDYWEMKKVLNGNDVDLGAESLSVAEKIELFANRLKIVDPYRSDRYRQAGQAILAQMNRILRDDLGETPVDDDYSTIADPTAPCKKELFAVQIRDPKPGETRFMIRRDLYESPVISNTTRAGIILHEVIYRDAIEEGQTDSNRARYYHFSVAADDHGATSSIEMYKWLLQKSGFRYRNMQPFFSPSFGQIIYLNPQNGEVTFPKELKTEFLDIKWKETAGIKFDKQGYITEISLDPKTAGGQVKFSGSWLKLMPNPNDSPSHIRVTFTPDGLPLWAHFEGVIAVTTRAGNILCQKYFIREGKSQDDFYFESCVLAEKTSLDISTINQFQKVDFAAGEFVYLDERGQVESGILDAPTRLEIAGTQLQAELKDYVRFGPFGGAEIGYFAIPKELEVLGQKELVERFDNSIGGKAETRITRSYDDPLFEGVRVLNFSDSYWAREICGTFGFDLPSGEVTSSEMKFMAGQQQVYDYKKKAKVLVTDEAVQLVKSLQCEGTATFTWPKVLN